MAHLVADFAELPAGQVIRELSLARLALETVPLESDDEGLLIAELIARNLLLMTTGQVPDVARLDPERHMRRSAER